jgi:hypothetical protein
MAFISLQGTSLTRSQRERLQQQQAVKSSFLNPVLAQSVADTIKELEVRKEQGVKPEKLWSLDRSSSWNGTISIAEWMGY